MVWDPAVVQNQWLESEARAQEAFSKVFQTRPQQDPNHFHDLCLSELDAARHLNQTQRFASKEEFINELKRLQNEPTSPSLPAFNEQAYAACQKQWLDFIIHQTLLEEQPPLRRCQDALIIIPALGFLFVGLFLISPALDEDRAHSLGMQQWHAFIAFPLCLLIFGLLCKLLDKPVKAVSRK